MIKWLRFSFPAENVLYIEAYRCPRGLHNVQVHLKYKHDKIYGAWEDEKTADAFKLELEQKIDRQLPAAAARS